MEVTRLNKIERLLQKELSELFRKQTAVMRGTLVTVSAVRVSPDLGLAKVYLSIFPSDKSRELLESVEKNKRTLRFDLGQIVRTQLRRIPELAFFIDDSLDYVENIDKILKSSMI
ncbi:MAG: 30S ribosome-binding factor RbfA [Tannerella sp.]|jgi:ribosome-binding factor A|nr:30S ribosome-binding factor RbfA [Tannerella sp.]